MTRMTKQQAEAVIQRDDSLDLVLYECMEIMKQDTKWGMDRDGKMTELYPHPIVSREAHRVSGVKYLPHKSYYLPEVLLERLIVLEDEIEKVNKPRAVRAGKLGRPSKHTADEVKQWVELRKQGATLGRIAKAFQTTQSTVSNNLTKYYAEQEAKQNG